MATRRDQLQSYQFLTQRVISAFVTRETDPPQSPLRRGIGAIFAGVMISILVAAGFGIYGIFTQVGGDAWRSDGAVVVERETGASFVYFADRLHPALNLTSAKLASATPHPAVHRVAGDALAAVPRGTRIGIPGAPDSLPPPRHQVGLPWTLCTEPATDGFGEPAGTVTLVVAGAPTDGRPLDDAATLVRDATVDATYLVWSGHRYRLHDPGTVVPALFGALVRPAPAGTSWLNALPAGVDIGPITFDRRGEPSTAVAGRAIGDLLVADTASGPQHYLVFDDGLAAISPLRAAVEAAYAPEEAAPVSISEASGAPRSNALGQVEESVRWPWAPPPLTGPIDDESLCAATGDPTTAPEVSVGGLLEALDAAIPTEAVSGGGASLADRVHVPAGRVAVVRALPAPTADTGSYYLVTDLGIRYAVPSPEVLAMLGYDPAGAVDVPASLLNKIPAGPTLDPSLATLPAA